MIPLKIKSTKIGNNVCLGTLPNTHKKKNPLKNILAIRMAERMFKILYDIWLKHIYFPMDTKCRTNLPFRSIEMPYNSGVRFDKFVHLSGVPIRLVCSILYFCDEIEIKRSI